MAANENSPRQSSDSPPPKQLVKLEVSGTEEEQTPVWDEPASLDVKKKKKAVKQTPPNSPKDFLFSKASFNEEDHKQEFIIEKPTPNSVDDNKSV